MSTVALSGARQRRSRVGPLDIIMRYGTTVAACVTATVVFLVAAFLIVYAYPALAFNGFGILTHLEWNLGNQYASGVEHRGGFTGAPGASFGAVVFITGTIVSSALAMAIATPLAILVAIAMHYQVPRRLKTPVNTLIELMAGVPSVVYGLWGIGVLVPWISNTVGPFLAAHFSMLPFIGSGAASGNGLLAASFILAVMVFPIMAATMRDVLSTFPKIVFEGAIGLGATPWQSVTTMVLPAIRTQMFAAAMLALGRALGETMAVLMVCGSALNQLPQNVFAPINTIAAVIVSQLDSALTDPTGMAERSLAELALILFAITLSVNLIARLIMRGSDRVKGTA
ncbi:MAG: phosphate ABC transporter permease subunit PstC [Vulcanimicrobiaceae bacterium]